MSAHHVAAGMVAGAAAVVVGAVPRGGTRLRRLGLPSRVEPRRPRRRPVTPARAAVVLAAVAVWWLVGGWVGAAAGAVVGFGVDRAVRRLEPRAVRAERAAATAWLPYAVDLLAATLRAGLPVDGAVAAVGAAVDGALGSRLVRLGHALRLGTRPAVAWSRALADLPEAAPLVSAAVRSSESGAALAGACDRVAAGVRGAREATADAASERAGVLVVLPLGACFLPAFVLVGVVPIVLGVLDDVLV